MILLSHLTLPALRPAALEVLGAGWRSHPRYLAPDPFHHKSPVCAITDIHPAMRDNVDEIGEFRRVPVSRDGHSSPQRSDPKALFDNSTVTRKVR
jgi:hypothetical protein